MLVYLGWFIGYMIVCVVGKSCSYMPTTEMNLHVIVLMLYDLSLFNFRKCLEPIIMMLCKGLNTVHLTKSFRVHLWITMNLPPYKKKKGRFNLESN